MASRILVFSIVVSFVAVADCSRADTPPGTGIDAARLVRERCASCHRFEGETQPKFQLRAPDLMWAGQKYQRTWLVGWLEGREPSPYPSAYRWDEQPAADAKPTPHPRLDRAEAEAVADHFERHLRDARIRKGAFDPSSLSQIEIDFGARLFHEYSCIGCHQVRVEGKVTGGPSSTHFFDAGRRYDADWVWAFNLDPPAFAPHSGEYVADLTERKVRWITGYLMTLGADDFRVAHPWEADAFRNADADRGEVVYRAYCAQCHGLSGEGDGPGARGLEPKPAAHAQMALDRLPVDYLYNVVFYGGKAVGKSTSMPDWGATLSTRQLADVMTYMTTHFRGAEAAATDSDTGMCPQPRTTADAPPQARAARNPLEPTTENLAAGAELYRKTAIPMACQFCHGESGNGLGPMAGGFDPPPRNFTCAQTMQPISDGQLFWVIRNGSPGTGMLLYPTLTDEQVWQLVLFLRSLAR